MCKIIKISLLALGLLAFSNIQPVFGNGHSKQENVAYDKDGTSEPADIACKVFGICD